MKNMFESDEGKKLFNRWNKDDKLNKLHKELTESGLKLCPLNFFTLCQYILTIIREQGFALLKPTVADTLSELSELSEVKSITFTDANGKTVTSNNSQLIDMVMGNIKAGDKVTYECSKFVRVDELTDKMLIQSSFAYNVALFLKEYFKDYHRRGNCCMVSAKEQELIRYMVYFFGLAPAVLSESRFRQWIKYYNEHRDRVNTATIAGEILPLQFVRYKDWKGGNVKLDKVEGLKVGDSVSFK
jgi:hypothetical protein